MKKIISTTAILLILIIGCEKQQIERISAPIGDGVQVDTSLEKQVFEAESELFVKIYECSLRQVQQGKIQPEQPKKIILTRASDPVNE